MVTKDCDSLHPKHCLAHSRHFATRRYRKSWLFWSEESPSHSVSHLCFWLILLPRTGPGFSAWQTGLYMPILTTVSLGNFLNTPSPQNHYCPLSFVHCTSTVHQVCAQDPILIKSVARLLLGSKGSKQTTKHPSPGYGLPCCCIYHDGTCARKAPCLPRRCENHNLCFPSLFFNCF